MIVISDRQAVRLAAVAALCAALGLSACGRKGPLDPPPGATAVPVQAEPTPQVVQAPLPGAGPPAATYSGIGADGKALAPPPSGQRQPFILDWLLN